MIPKPVRKKRRRHHAESILQKGNYCYLCALQGIYGEKPGLHKHHIYGGPLRQISEEYGFWVKLCPWHQVSGPQAVHMNIKAMRYLQAKCQEEFEKTRTRQEFISLVGRNYL